MTAALFWRVRFLNGSGGASTSIWLDEVEFLDVVNQVIPVTGGAALASSEYPGGAYPASQAFDGSNATNGWSGAYGAWPQWIGYGFPAPVTPEFIRLTMPETANASDELPVGVVFIDKSEDGVLWDQAYFGIQISGAFAVGQVVLLKIALRQAARAIGTVHRTPDVGFDSGPGTITGTAKNIGLPANAPVFRRIRLHEQSGGRFVRETWSDATTGAYSFTGLRITRYYIVGFDHTGTYSGVIETDVTPEVLA